MEQLDTKTHPENCKYITIGGKCSKLHRMPSSLQMQSSERCRGYGGRRFSQDTNGSLSRPNSCNSSGVFRWKESDVAEWLKESGFEQYESNFVEHAICGNSLAGLQEEHLKEIGVLKVGHRLELLKCIDELRRDADLVSREKYADISILMTELNAKQIEKTISLYPRRIILIRHGESEGNVNNALYAKKPDRLMELTSVGVQQAYEAGVELKKLIREESVSFYVSPFQRSTQTYEQIRQSFNDEQVLHVREDPRIREQEWGNFQDPMKMMSIMSERRKVGSFYYRFPTGESGADVYDRVSTFLETMYRDMDKGGCGENTIVVSHGLFCRLFLMRYFHWKVEKFHKLWNFTNCQYAIMELQPGGHYRLISELKSDP